MALSGKEITDKGKEATKLLDRLKTLQNKRDKLNEKLADKPKKILEELTEAVDDVDRRSQDLVLCQANYDTCLRRILPPGCVAQILT